MNVFARCDFEENIDIAHVIPYNNVHNTRKEVQFVKAVNVTVRVDEETKREFDAFCENVGMNITTAFNMFMRAVLRTRELPFPVTDIESQEYSRKTTLARGREAFRKAQEQAVINGTSNMTLDEINDLIAACNQERQ